jgi:hypothetical protein
MIKSRRMRWGGHVACMGDEKYIQILVGKPEGKRPLRTPRHKWEDNTKINLREIGWEAVEWIYLDQNRDWWQPLVNMVMKFHVQ